MPELPEVETIKRELEPYVVGRTITGVTLFWEGIAKRISVAEFRARLIGQKITGLERNGKPGNLSFTSSPVDGAVASPLAAAPVELKATAQEGGVALYWSPARAERNLPVIAYVVERDETLVTLKPLVRGLRWNASQPALLDRNAPLENELTYRVFAVDVLGRRSEPASVKLFAADFKALEPPFEFNAAADRDEVTLRWKGSGNPHTAGYVIERAYLHDGPYETLTPQGLRADVARHTDRNLRPGTAYYYRMRAMGPRGDLGNPSRVAMVQTAGRQAPPAVSGLKAEVGRTRVHLAWEPVSAAVAGYFIERRGDGEDQWLRLNGLVRPEPFYDDYYGPGRSGEFRYRIVAVGYDNQESRPGRDVAATLPDTVPPAAPHITSIDGSNGKVKLDFAPAGREEDSEQFLVLRAISPRESALVLGDPLPRKARSFEDTLVEVGKVYWYQLVALDKSGNRSDPGSAVAVRVGNAEIPPARKPEVTRLSEPFPHALVRFAAPPAGLEVVIQFRTSASDAWIVLAGPVAEGGEATHANLPRGTRVKVATGAALQTILFGPTSKTNGTENLVGALRTSMGVCSSVTVRDMHKTRMVIAPSIKTEGKIYQIAQGRDR